MRWPKRLRPEDSHILKSPAAAHPLGAHAETPKGRRSIPSLDGLRAVAVLMVIVSHLYGWSSLPQTGWAHDLFVSIGQGGLGVSIFFVISGFLITTLLLQEQERTGTIGLGRFYFRRAMRIFPPYYVYLLVAAAAAWWMHRAIPLKGLLVSAGYISNYVPYTWLGGSPGGWYLLHTWSLSVEEQFYLLWPFLLLLVARRNAVRLAFGILLAAPFARLGMVHLLPLYGVGGQWLRLLHTTLDLLVFGGLLAFGLKNGRFRERVQRFFHPLPLLSAFSLLLMYGHIQTHVPLWAWGLFGVSLSGASIALLLLWVVLRPEPLVGRLLNLAPLRHIGLISYSLYLWQQLFLGPFWVPSGWKNLLAVLAAAEASFWIVERPSLRLRDRIEARFAR